MLSLTNLSTTETFSNIDETFFNCVNPLDKSFVDLLTAEEISSNVSLWTDKSFKSFKSLNKLKIEYEDSREILSEDIVTMISQCSCLKELSLPYSSLSDDLLTVISSDNHVPLKTIKIEAYSDSKPLPRISDEAWFTLENHSPNLNLVLNSYLSEEDDYDALLVTAVPVTHLFLNGSPPETIVRRIGENCPRLVELVVSSYNFGTIDQALISTAKGCPNLSAVGLGDCEITCSGLVEFVGLCKERLQILYIWETSLIEDTNFNISEATTQVSSLLGRKWMPESIPPW
ncbi:F-box/LRR-repeat protein 21-like [Chelonus insularis]|uniref:F-box/LRR-repeat protein 21-like n=1 Tax=Chelonus insularis TaxID=460826 RepID=UPI00158EA8B8|nr:F-box/LRR-repeat protein 21-like [Chelonus insularis]